MKLVNGTIKKSETEKLINLREVWLDGKNPWVTIDNPNNLETRARKIKIRAKDLWGDPRKHTYSMYGSGEDKNASKKAATAAIAKAASEK